MRRTMLAVRLLVAVLLSLLCHTTALSPPCSRSVVQPTRRAALAGVLGLAVPSMPALALVTGSKPPEGGFKAKKTKCKNIDACEAAGEKAADEKFGSEEVAFERTGGGDRFRDLTPGTGRKAAQGDAVEIRYRVMRLGTRARDGLSGEGQTSATTRARTHHQPSACVSRVSLLSFCLRQSSATATARTTTRRVTSWRCSSTGRPWWQAPTPRSSGCSPAAGGACWCDLSAAGGY